MAMLGNEDSYAIENRCRGQRLLAARSALGALLPRPTVWHRPACLPGVSGELGSTHEREFRR